MGSKAGIIKVAAKRIGVSLDVYRGHISAGEKWCHNCRVWKLRETFGKDMQRGDGLAAICLDCRRRRYIPTKRGPSPLRGTQMSLAAKRKMAIAHTGTKNHRWKGGISLKTKRSPEAKLAKRAVAHAIEAGRLAPAKSLPCFDCGKQAKEYHHYRGYAKANWLEVQALCIRCHRTRHRN